ncbi:lipopolysaccharide biosynthesis protein [Pleomorphomonas sp. JP5]|uniref:lipopolysaccharide biosynthesis protein n=1 Tax=Pleomorphomonas sp. JP5 TaxID=2942998 RepID=UPI0020433937|nr:hypothetical protein [Pleomorphomonas sp. JP5]MCM5559387.1 hypothetical protein [Pleomorphomonas sp. JP5]
MVHAKVTALIMLTTRTVGATVVAHVVNQIVIILTQLVIIPIIASKWGSVGLGAWMSMTALPTYLTISDFGFTYSAKSDMSVRMMANDVVGAKITSSSTLMLLVTSLFVAAVIYGGSVYALNWQGILNLQSVTLEEIRWVLILGLVQVCFFQLFLLSAAAIRSSGRPALEASLDAVARGMETTALAVTIFAGGGFAEAAMAWSFTRAAFTIAVWIWLYVTVPQLMPGLRWVRWERIKELSHPSAAYIVIPLANAILIQGVVILIGIMAGPLMVAGYSVARIITRMGVSAANVLNYAFTPQYSYLIGRKLWGDLHALYKIHVGLIVIGTVLYVLAVVLLGEHVGRALSHGQVEVSDVVLLFLMFAAVFEMLWTPSLSFASASNKVGDFSVLLLIDVIFCICLGCSLSIWFGVEAFSFSVALCHFFMFVYAMKKWSIEKKKYGEREISE